MRWAGHVARVGRVLVHTGFLWGNMTERDHLEDPDLGGMIILKRIFRKWAGEKWPELMWLRIEQVAGCCECGNEPWVP